MFTFSVENLPIITGTDWSRFDYAINSFTGKGNCWNQKCGTWNYGPVIDEEKSDIPESDMVDYNQFETVYFARPGRNDEESWTFLVKHKNGYYVSFDASCDYTGFDCQGGGSITYSEDGKKMWSFGLTNKMREEIIQK